MITDTGDNVSLISTDTVEHEAPLIRDTGDNVALIITDTSDNETLIAGYDDNEALITDTNNFQHHVKTM